MAETNQPVHPITSLAKKNRGHHGLKSKLKKYFNLHPEFLLDISSLLMQVENKNYIQISKMNVHESKNDTS